MKGKDSEVRVAVLGASSFAEIAHIPGVNAHPRARVVALYGRDLGRTPATAEHARHVSDIIESGYRAARSGRTQQLSTAF